MQAWPARLADGRSTTLRDVSAQFTPGGLAIRQQDGLEIAVWPYAEIHLVDAPGKSSPVRLKLGEDGLERLTIDDTDSWTPLRDAAPHLFRRLPDRRGWRRFGIVAGSMGAVVGMLVFGVSYIAAIVAALIPLGWEEAMGRSALDQIVPFFAQGRSAEEASCKSEPGRIAVDRLTRRLNGAIEAPYRFKVMVIDTKMVNAFALPGGYIVFFDGLVQSADSPDEVAAVLAHEIAHVVERHGTEAMLRNMGYDVLFDAMSSGSTAFDAAAGAGELLLTLSNGREAERTADRLGLEILRDAGIRGDGMAAFFERMAEEQGSGLQESLSFLSSHPSSEERVETARAAASPGGDSMSEADWQALRKICADQD